jgi:hypothetical protein
VVLFELVTLSLFAWSRSIFCFHIFTTEDVCLPSFLPLLFSLPGEFVDFLPSCLVCFIPTKERPASRGETAAQLCHCLTLFAFSGK